MRQRYRDLSFDSKDEPSNRSFTEKMRYIPQEIGAKFNPPAIYLFFKDTQTGKLKRRKMPVRAFVLDKDSPQAVGSTEEIAKQLVSRHQILETASIDRLIGILSRLRTQLKIPEPVIQKTNPPPLVQKPKLSDLPSLPAKSMLPVPKKSSDIPPITAAAKPADVKPLTAAVDGNVNLNKLSDQELSIIKNDMNTEFEKNRIKPGDPGFQYDVQKQFEPTTEDNDWDSSSVSEVVSKPKSAKSSTNNRAFGDLETDDEVDELSEFNEEISDILEDKSSAHIKYQKPSEKLVVEKDEDSGAASESNTAFWWMKQSAAMDILKRDGDVALPSTSMFDVKPVANVAVEPLPATRSMFDQPAKEKPAEPPTAKSMFEPKQTASIAVAEKADILAKAVVNKLQKEDPATSILQTSGMSATMAALQQAKALLDQAKKDEVKVEVTIPTGSSKEVNLQPAPLSKLGPLPTLSKHPGVTNFNNKPFVPLDKLNEPTSPTSTNTDKSYSTPQSAFPAETVLDINIEDDIDAGFANYDADADLDGDFLDLIMPKKNVAPILPLSTPNKVQESPPVPELKEIVFKKVDSPLQTLPPPASKIISLSPEATETKQVDHSVVSSKPATGIEDEIEIDEDFDNFDVDKESDEDLSFLTKGMPKETGTAEISSRSLSPVHPVGKVNPPTPIQPSSGDHKKEEQKINSASKPAGPLGDLPSLFQKQSIPSTGVSSFPKPIAAPLSSVSSSIPLKSAAKKSSMSNDDIDEDFDFEMDDNSISDLLGDSEDKAANKKETVKSNPGISAASIKGLIPGIGANKSAILDKFAESAMKILSDDTDEISKKSKTYTDDFGAGDTDSEGEVSKVSAIADQSPAFKKSVQFLSDNEEDDDLFKDEDIDLEVDDGPAEYDNDAF
ncbi:UNVERIFIED_CONTAM: Centrosomal protein of 19 kDa [Siphonaria sp. JEL0065]|nr:Centrosomal protein of 19 kDa [Siphonaria sp. JEL0065]